MQREGEREGANQLVLDCEQIKRHQELGDPPEEQVRKHLLGAQMSRDSQNKPKT